MDFEEYRRYDAVGLAALVARGEVSAEALLELALARSREVGPRINAIVHDLGDAALSQLARRAPAGALAGVPFLVKDVSQDIEGVPTLAGSRALMDAVAPATVTAVRRWMEAGLIVFGKTATPEFALKGITEAHAYGATRNPWNLARTPGGSSGGAAAAVAAGIVPMAGANDGGGSIRIPAAYCGLFGLRPSRGRVPMGPTYGELWEGASSDLVVSRSVRDSALALDLAQGADVGAPFVIAPPQRPYLDEAAIDPPPLRIGVLTRSPIGTPVDAACVEAVDRTATLLESLGHHVEWAEPDIDGAALADSYLRMYFGQVAADVERARRLTGRNDFEAETRALAALGRSMNAGEYVASRRRWNVFARALGDYHQRYDLLMTPTVAMRAARIGELELSSGKRLMISLMLGLRASRLALKSGMVRQLAQDSLQRTPFTQLSNLTGTPSMSVPLHWDGEGMPVGVQFVAAFGGEDRLLQLAGQLERAQPWFDRVPTDSKVA